MRYLFCGVLIGFCLATPVLAQPSAATSNSSATPSAMQGHTAKDGNAGVPKTANAGTDQDKSANAPATPTSTADPMSDYNVNGNAVGDGLGVPR
jgi:hypothetical protein